MSQRAGDYGSQMMFARSQYEQNAKRKNVVIPKGTAFKNVKIRMSYNHSNGTYYLSTEVVKDKKRGAYDEGQRAFKESDFKVTNLLEAGNNFFNVKNFLIVKNNGFDISENAIVDIELNKDITVSIFDEPYIDPMNQDPQKNQVSFLESHPKLIMMVFIAVGVYIGYKKFIK